MWIINNLLDVIRALEEKQLSLNHVSTWDFSTLYTSLPHAQLKEQLHDLLERVFNTKGKSFIATNNFRTFWANHKTPTKYTYFSCRELGLAIDFLIDNIHLRSFWKLGFPAGYWYTHGHQQCTFVGWSLPSYLWVRFCGQNNETRHYKIGTCARAQFNFGRVHYLFIYLSCVYI